MSLFNELRRRNVFRIALLYVVAGWVVLQIADVLFDPLGLPEWTFRLVLGLLLLGFPFALILAWVFELTPDGLKRERDVDRSRSVTQQTGRKMNLVIAILLVVAIAGLALDRLLPEPSAPPESPVSEQLPAGEWDIAKAESLPDNSIAVLPFLNMSGDPDNEYFSDGLTEELLNTLVRIGGLKVTGRTSSFAFKGRNQDLREVGQQLNVANVLEGSVRKSGNRVRITAQLVKTSDGYHLWSDTYDRELDDIFAIQQEIAGHVTEALEVALLGGTPDDPVASGSGDRDARAYEEYLRGMYIWQRNPDDRAELDRARGHFETALSIDPGYLDAYWGMFMVWDRMNRNGHGPFNQSLERMQHYASELRRLAPDSARALSAAARIAIVDYDYRTAVDYLERAAQWYPGDVSVLGEYASALSVVERYEEALDAAGRAQQLDPLSLDIMRWKSYIYHRKGDCDGAEQIMRRAMEIEPEVGRFRYYAAMCIFETTGDLERAVPLAEAEPLGFAHDTALAIFYNERGDHEAAQAQLDNMFASYGDAASYQYGQVYTQWGEHETALAWLENALKIRDPGIIQAADDRSLIPLRGNPRFEKILRDVGFR
jgi:serine/threonine-protein kinase